MRSGQVTASKFQAACHTDPTNPAVSLILGICHPELSKFSTAATRWGCSHKGKALKAYHEFMETKHECFSVSASGLHIHPDYWFLGASPDSLVKCNCCGNGICEIKVCFQSQMEKHFCLLHNALCNILVLH